MTDQTEKSPDITDIHTDNTTDNWYTVPDAAAILKVTERTIWRRIKTGKIGSKLEHGTRYVKIDKPSDDFTDESETMSEQMSVLVSVEQLQKENERLQQEINEVKEALRQREEDIRRKDEHTAEIMKAAEEAGERHDMIVMQLTRQLEQSQRLLEYHEEPWYRRWFRKGRSGDTP